jgi:hypothetical protein
MYGLPQVGKLNQTRLIQHLKENGYTQCPNTPCLFRHHTLREIMFCLVVDDFGVRYKTQTDADHLIHTLEKYEYKLKVRPLGDVYLGMTISFDRPNKTVSISMPGYVKKMLQRFRPQFLLPGHRQPRTPGVYIAHLSARNPRPSSSTDPKKSPRPSSQNYKLLLEPFYTTPALSTPLYYRSPTNSPHSRLMQHDDSSTQPIAR